MNIVETDQYLTILFDKISRDTFYFDVVALDDQKHFANNHISVIFFKFMADEELNEKKRFQSYVQYVINGVIANKLTSPTSR